MKYTPLRPAIAMIELIFAIVIIGIVLLSAPQLISTSAQSGYVAIQQEAINEAATQLNLILGYSWDENDANETSIPPILGVTNGDIGLDKNASTGKRAGTPTESYRSFFRSDGAELNASNPLGAEAGDRDDMDDFNGISTLLAIESSNEDYIETTTVKITTTVQYASDTPGGGTYLNPGADNKITFVTAPASATRNIKLITVNLTSTDTTNAELTKDITLKSFSANIGGYDLEERIF